MSDCKWGSDSVRLVGDSYVRFKEMTWPLYDGELEWRLRYGGEVSKQDALHAASILAAYGQMIFDPENKRRAVIRGLRKAFAALTSSQEKP